MMMIQGSMYILCVPIKLNYLKNMKIRYKIFEMVETTIGQRIENHNPVDRFIKSVIFHPLPKDEGSSNY